MHTDFGPAWALPTDLGSESDSSDRGPRTESDGDTLRGGIQVVHELRDVSVCDEVLPPAHILDNFIKF